MAAPTTVAAMLPMVAVMGFATFASGFAGGTIPGATAGVVAPNPVPHRTINSPGFAGTAVTPGAVPPANQVANVANPITVTIGNIAATVVGAAIAPGNAGLYQIAVQVPDSVPDGDLPVVAQVNGVQSSSNVLLNVKR